MQAMRDLKALMPSAFAPSEHRCALAPYSNARLRAEHLRRCCALMRAQERLGAGFTIACPSGSHAARADAGEQSQEAIASRLLAAQDRRAAAAHRRAAAAAAKGHTAAPFVPRYVSKSEMRRDNLVRRCLRRVRRQGSDGADMGRLGLGGLG
jgi:hypothetical protein